MKRHWLRRPSGHRLGASSTPEASESSPPSPHPHAATRTPDRSGSTLDHATLIGAASASELSRAQISLQDDLVGARQRSPSRAQQLRLDLKHRLSLGGSRRWTLAPSTRERDSPVGRMTSPTPSDSVVDDPADTAIRRGQRRCDREMDNDSMAMGYSEHESLPSTFHGRSAGSFYVKQQRIGKGSFGEVFKGYDTRTGMPVAIKVIDLEHAHDEIEDIQQEIAILGQVDSPHVTRYYDSFLDGSQLWIVMEYCGGGSCEDLLKAGTVPEDYIVILLRELLFGLDCLHRQGKLHRDVKAANVLLTSRGDVKLADFGVSGQLTATVAKRDTFVRTPYWMAPEVIQRSGHDAKADIWSLGITAIELATGHPPNAALHPMRVLFVIAKGPPPSLDALYRLGFSNAFIHFVRQCLQLEATARPTAAELLDHPLVRGAGDTAHLTDLIERTADWRLSHTGLVVDEEGTATDPESLVESWEFASTRRTARRIQGGTVTPRTAASTSDPDDALDSILLPAIGSVGERIVMDAAAASSVRRLVDVAAEVEDRTPGFWSSVLQVANGLAPLQ